MIVGLGHQAQVGKDTAASILVEKYGFKRLAFADKLKEMALDINPLIPRETGVGLSHVRLSEAVQIVGWEETKAIPEARAFLQRLGVAARDHLGQDVWVKAVFNQMDPSAWRYEGERYVITDVRFPNEFSALAKKRAYLIKLTREAAPSAGTHISETALADAEWDIIMGNNGTLEDLEANLVAALDLEAAA